MSQDPSQGDWQGWGATPPPEPQPQPYAYPYPYAYPQSHGFDPADPLISNDYNGWWHRGFGLVKAAWRPMAIIQAIVGVPALILLLPAMVVFQREQAKALASIEASAAADAQLDFSLFFSGLSALLPAALAAGLIYTLGQLACQQVVVFTATGRTGGLVGPAFLAAVKRMPALIGWSLLTVPVLIVALVLCFFPVIYVGAVLAILPVVVLLERGAGIGRCFQLFHASLGVSVSRIATIGGLSVAANLVLAMLDGVVSATIGGSYQTPNSTATVINTVLQSAYFFATYLVVAPLLVTTYADMRARHESFTTASLVPADPPHGH
jgi:hypothetical protein